MSLFRCTQLLRRENVNFLNPFKVSTVFYSDDKKSSDDGAQSDKEPAADEAKKKDVSKKSSKQTETDSKQSFSPESQNRLNILLKRLSSRSALNIVNDVQVSKPIGYQNIRQNQKVDASERKPRNFTKAARAVSQELGDERVMDEILAPFQVGQKDTGFIEYVLWLESRFIMIITNSLIVFTVMLFQR